MDSIQTVDRKELFRDIKRIVLKIGTSSLTIADGSFNCRLTQEIANQVAELRKHGITVIIVSSGAIGIGCEEWIAAFNKHDIKVAQILLTYEAFSSRMTYLNLRNSISTLLEAGVIPVIN